MCHRVIMSSFVSLCMCVMRRDFYLWATSTDNHVFLPHRCAFTFAMGHCPQHIISLPLPSSHPSQRPSIMR